MWNGLDGCCSLIEGMVCCKREIVKVGCKQLPGFGAELEADSVGVDVGEGEVGGCVLVYRGWDEYCY